MCRHQLCRRRHRVNRHLVRHLKELVEKRDPCCKSAGKDHVVAMSRSVEGLVAGFGGDEFDAREIRR